MSTEETKLIDLTGGKVLYDDLRERIDKIPEQIPSVPDMSIHFPGNGYKLNMRNYVNSTEHASAEGYLTTASGSCAHAEGYDTTASGTYSHAEGVSTTASEESGHAEGNGCTASGQGSHAEGWHTTASGSNSHAEGNQTNASGEEAHAEGINTVASGDRSHAEGVGTTASGSESHAEGYHTTASHHAGHAEGYGASAIGHRSHAEGYNTIALGTEQHVFGAYNVSDGNSGGHVKGQYVEIVGNGTADNARSNARTLDWQGNEWLAGKVSVGTVASPTPVTNANDLTTKAYVDNAVAGVTVPVQDVQVNGTSVLDAQGVANVPRATMSTVGVVKPHGSYGVGMWESDSSLRIDRATDDNVKTGNGSYKPIVPSTQHASAFYGLAKAAGHDEASSTEPLGTYTPSAKAAIQSMLGVSDLIATAENNLVAS